MANKKISQLTGATTPLTGTEELAIVQGGQTVKATAQDIADLGGGGTLPVETVYPTTDALKAGTRFWYKGNEWHYMTQAEIDSTGWTGLVTEGFPAPVNKVINSFVTFAEVQSGNIIISDFTQSQPASYIFPSYQLSYQSGVVVTKFDFLGYGRPNLYKKITVSESYSGVGISEFRNANMLINLQDSGTQKALIAKSNMSAETIDDLFTQLPLTVKTATINVASNPGSATCDPTIATAKGYTVIV